MIYAEDKRIQRMAELEETWLLSKARYAAASHSLMLSRAKKRLDLEAKNELSDKGKKKSASEISAELTVFMDSDPQMLSLRVAKLDAKAIADHAGVEFHAAKHMHYVSRG